MYLKRITVTGFKSFASKAVLDLEPGITAVVGPNGSGKSNLADAVRWALGEQSKGRLRVGDREEVVFAGTEKRAKASYAEVVLLFDNEDGAFGLDLTEVEISRRLYRSGEADYRLGGRTVRLADIQQLLAEAGFGTNTYAVIGQGMIDNFLLSSPAERKLLFDEAAGIRGAELRREAALRKMTATEANVTRLRDICAELEPRLASLRRAAAAEAELEALAGRLRRIRTEVVSRAAQELGEREAQFRRDQVEIASQLQELRRELRLLEHTQRHELDVARAAEARRAKLQAELSALEDGYAAAREAVATLRGRHDHLSRSVANGGQLKARESKAHRELAAAQDRAAELIEQLTANEAAAETARRALERAGQAVDNVQAELVALRQTAGDGTQQQYVAHALELLKTIAQGLRDDTATPDQLKLLVHKAGRLLSHATRTSEAELVQRLRQTQVRLEAAMARRDTATEHQTNITITSRSLEIDLAHQQAAVTRFEERSRDLRSDMVALGQLSEEAAKVQRQVKAADQDLLVLKRKLDQHRAQASQNAPEDRSAQVAELATRLERLRSQQGSAELALAAARQGLEAIRPERQRYMQLAHVWGVAIGEALAAGPTTLAELEQTQLRLEAELTARRAAQRETASELTEVNARHAGLAIQIADLEEARVHLEQGVAELDQLIRERFKENFTKLSEHFSRYFVRLFGGGSAALELSEQDDGAYGIVIKVSPKGKRLGNLTALSGGERAMAGVALLAAILSVNPSPFVVLDEIDAALDEANSGRLADILDELAEKSQLIVITHNRQTMRAAKVLFGVTMNEHHVSHLLSLRLEEASALAAR